jgi:hypothetical protein
MAAAKRKLGSYQRLPHVRLCVPLTTSQYSALSAARTQTATGPVQLLHAPIPRAPLASSLSVRVLQRLLARRSLITCLVQDVQGPTSSTCTNQRQLNFCCQPSASEQFLPVPEDWVIPVGVGYDSPEQPASFTLDFDDDTGSSDSTSQGAGSTGISDDGDENESPFGEVFITSPNSQSVSSLDTHSDWVIVGCDAKSDQPQSVLAYCSMDLDHEESGCAHVFIGGAEHTIVGLA